MELIPEVEALPENTAQRLVTMENYCCIRDHIENQIEHFLINSESWILSLFKKIPQSPNPVAVDTLEPCVHSYLPKRIIRDLRTRFGDSNNHKRHQNHSARV